MLLYIIRHGDPIYETDSLTELGQKQAEALSERLAVHGLDKIYSSTAKRAQLTAEPTCRKLGLEYELEDWANEGHAWKEMTLHHPDGPRWAFQIQNTLLRNDKTVLLNEKWAEAECFSERDLTAGVARITAHSDDFLARQGYVREGSIYRIEKPSDKRVALFCHQGFGLTWLSHLLHIPLHIFWAGFDITHASVTIISFENYSNGFTAPRCLCLSDISHIYKAGLPLKYNNEAEI